LPGTCFQVACEVHSPESPRRILPWSVEIGKMVRRITEQPDLSNEHIRLVLRPYGVAIDSELCEAIRVYISLLLQWNRKISLTTISAPNDILRVHFGESFFAAVEAGIANGRVADIGSGPGFPGIPIRMVRHLVDLTLVEPIAKKTAFLGEVVRRLGLSIVRIIRCRMEDVPAEVCGLDFVTARALGRYEDLLDWAKSRLSSDGRIVLLVGQAEVAKLSRMEGWTWRKPIKVPQSDSRFVLVGAR
jgi:16S rRNA (guanine527-N7)-methyltransferase